MRGKWETSITVKNVWIYLYQAVDSEGNTLEFLLSPMRVAEAAKHFLLKSMHSTVGSVPQALPAEEQVEELPTAADSHIAKPTPGEINVEKNATYPKAMAGLKATGSLPKQVERRQVKSLKNLIEQDHHFIKRLVKQGCLPFGGNSRANTSKG